MLGIFLLDPLDKDEQIELFKKYRETKDKAIREKLILHNLRLVSFISNKCKTDKLESEDLFQTGVIGLIRAIESYDYTKGAFSTYAIYWIKQSIIRDIENIGATIRVPSHMVQSRRNLLSVKNKLIEKLGREPTLKEISIKANLSIKKVDYILNVADDPISLNIPTLTEDDNTTLEDTIADDKPLPDEIIESKIFMERFEIEAIERLTPLQYNLIIESYGIYKDEKSIKDLTDKYNLKSIDVANYQRQRGLETLSRTRYFMELWEEIDSTTSYIKGIDYTQPKVIGGLPSSSVENIVLRREKRFERLKERYI